MMKLIFLCSALAVAFAKVPTPELIDADAKVEGQYNFIAQMIVTRKNGVKFEDTAVLISTRHLLAKASDIADIASIRIVLGAHFPDKFEEAQQIFTVDSSGVILPEGNLLYLPGIIVLPTSVKITKRIQPALLPRWRDVEKVYAGTTGTFVKWQKIDGETRRIAYREVDVVENKNCNVDADKDKSNLCVPYLVATGGDTGAPLVQRMTNGKQSPLVTVGIFSYVALFPRDGEILQTNVFIKLSDHLKFISENTGVFIRP